TRLLLPAAGSLAVFAALGLGLALPFVLVAFVPSLRTKLPKPGRWMDRLKRVLAIPMTLSAAAVLWLLYRQAGATGLLLGIAAAAILLVVLFGAGRQQRRGGPAYWALSAALAIAGVLILIVPQPTIATANSAASAASWSEAKVASSLQE